MENLGQFLSESINWCNKKMTVLFKDRPRLLILSESIILRFDSLNTIILEIDINPCEVMQDIFKDIELEN